MVDYLSDLEVMSRASRIRLSGIVCTIGPVSRDPAVLYEMMECGMVKSYKFVFNPFKTALKGGLFVLEHCQDELFPWQS